jgi:SAM-dependent methyltransferase
VNYAKNFGFQWNRFRATQLDSHTGVPTSRSRFLEQSGWTEADLKGKLVLDVGCGAGRFAEIALSLGANVIALDYSAAVVACKANLERKGSISVLQADIYNLPFKPETFDFIYCFGVLQHTPYPKQAFKSIPPLIKPNGRLAVDVYPWLLRNILFSKYWVRGMTKRIEPSRLFTLVERATPFMLGVSRAVGKIPKIGHYLSYLIPVANYDGLLGLSESQVREWAVLDTFDMLAPVHDHPQRAATLRTWFEDTGLADIEILRRGVFVGRGRKPDAMPR